MFAKPKIPEGFQEFDQAQSKIWLANDQIETLKTSFDLSNPHQLAKDYPAGFGGRGELALLKLEEADSDSSYVVRPYLRGGLFGPLLQNRYLDPFRSLRELNLYAEAKKRSISTLTAVGAIAQKSAWGTTHGLISKLETGVVDVEQFLLGQKFAATFEKVFQDLGHAVRQMHDAGFFHPDLNIKNLLLRQSRDSAQTTAGGSETNETSQRVLIIDFDRGQFYPELTPSLRENNLLRLLRSFMKFQKKYRLHFRQKTEESQQVQLIKWFHQAYFEADSNAGEAFWQKAATMAKTNIRFRFSQWRTKTKKL